jgi:uncharacterized protein with HEPN domain
MQLAKPPGGAFGGSPRNAGRLLSLVRCIEIIGEAAARVSAEMRATVPELPWQDIVGMRNRLIQAYFDVDHDRVWDTVERDLPGLIAALQNRLQQESDLA